MFSFIYFIFDSENRMTAQATWIFLFALLQVVFGIFNADELKIMNYEVDILSSPIQANKDVDLPVLYMTSKFGQQYQCMLPQLIQAYEETSSNSKETGEAEIPEIQDLLKPLRGGPCLIKPKDWWTYELCVGQNIRQYHIEDSQISGSVASLGIYDSDYDWSSQTDKNGYMKLKQPRYHSQFYVNGSNCDLTGKLRTTEVRFFCEADVGDYIYRVDEPETCRYIITVHTDRVCSHPYLKPAPSAKPHTIQCKPVLEEEHYAKYMQRAQEEQEKAELKRQEWIGEQQKQLEELKLRLLQQREEQESETDPKDEEEVVEEESPTTKEEKEDEDDEDLISAFEKDIGGMTAEERKQVLKERSQLREAISKEFDNIIEEAEDELQQEVDERIRDGVYTKLASTLNRLIDKLDMAEKDVAQATARFKKVHHHLDKLQTSKQKLPKNEEAGEEEEEEDTEEQEAEGEEEEENEAQLMPDFDNKVQVRVRKIGSETRAEDGKVHWFRQKDLDQAQKLKLEEAVRDKLEKAGLDSNGRRIEVRIITAGYYNNEEENGKSFHVLSDEETQQFQNMIFTLLTGSQEARKELERQHQMEKNYQFVWGEDKPHSDETEES